MGEKPRMAVLREVRWRDERGGTRWSVPSALSSELWEGAERATLGLSALPVGAQVEESFEALGRCCQVSVLRQEGGTLEVMTALSALPEQESLLVLQRDLALALGRSTSLAQTLQISLDFAIQASALDCGGF